MVFSVSYQEGAFQSFLSFWILLFWWSRHTTHSHTSSPHLAAHQFLNHLQLTYIHTSLYRRWRGLYFGFTISCDEKRKSYTSTRLFSPKLHIHVQHTVYARFTHSLQYKHLLAYRSDPFLSFYFLGYVKIIQLPHALFNCLVRYICSGWTCGIASNSKRGNFVTGLYIMTLPIDAYLS